MRNKSPFHNVASPVGQNAAPRSATPLGAARSSSARPFGRAQPHPARPDGATSRGQSAAVGLLSTAVYALAAFAIASTLWGMVAGGATEVTGKPAADVNGGKGGANPTVVTKATAVSPSTVGTKLAAVERQEKPPSRRAASRNLPADVTSASSAGHESTPTPPRPNGVAVSDAGRRIDASSLSAATPRLLRLRRINAADIKELVAAREAASAARGVNKDQNYLQIILQSARTGAVLHPVAFTSPKGCDAAHAAAYTAASDSSERPNTLILPSSPAAACLHAADGGGGGSSSRSSSRFLSFAADASSAVMTVGDFNAAVYNVTLAARKFKKAGEDGLVVGGAAGADDPAAAAIVGIPKDLRLRAANYGTYLSREVHHGTVTVDKMWARSMEGWSVLPAADGGGNANANNGAEEGNHRRRTYELRGIPHELQPNGEHMCVGFEGAAPGGPPAHLLVHQPHHAEEPAAGDEGRGWGGGGGGGRLKAVSPQRFVPPRFIEVPKGGGWGRGTCDTYILWELEEGEADVARAEAASRLAAATTPSSLSAVEATVGAAAGAPPIHLVSALSIRSTAIFSSEKQRYNDKVVLDNWLRLLQQGGLLYPKVLTQLALCLDTAGDLATVLSAAEGYGFSVAAGTIAVLRSPTDAAADASESQHETHRTLADYFTSRRKSAVSGAEAVAEPEAEAEDGSSSPPPLAPIVPRIVVSAHCEKHPSYKDQPTYRGAFSFGEYVLRGSQLHMQRAKAAHKEEASAAPFPHPIAVDASFVSFSNGDIVLDYTDVFRTVAAVAAEMAQLPTDEGDGVLAEATMPRPVLISGRRWNCGTQQIEKAMRRRKEKGGRKEKKRGSSRRGGNEGPPAAGASHATYMDTHYLRTRCTLFGDNAQDYFIATAGALRWGMPPGIPAVEAFAGATGALRRAIDASHTDTAVLVQDSVAAVPLADGLARRGDYFPDALVSASAYRRSHRAERWNSALHIVPPFVVGGIAFDNWFVSAMMQRRRAGSGSVGPLAWVIDASSSLYAFHMNHDEGRFQSHRAPKSEYNLEMAHYCNGWPEGKVGASPIVGMRLPFDTASSSLLPSAAAMMAHGGHGAGHGVVEPTRVVIHRRSILYCPLGLPAEACHLPPPNVDRRISAFDGPFEPRR